jgi:CheY-like chemotaxis protein
VTPDPSHVAVFHRQSADIIERIATFAAAGLAAGERVYVIATPERWAGVASRLEADEPRFRQALDVGRLLWLDAADVVHSIAPEGMFDRHTAVRMFDQLLGRAGRCRLYGEMVTLLMQQGHVECAAALETLGHELAHDRKVDILCGYDLEGLDPLARARLADLHDRAVEAGTPGCEPTLDAAHPLILLVDDVEDARDMYSEYLRWSGFRVVTAANGAEAIRLAHLYVPDVVLMDVRMPVVTGPEALRQLRTDPRLDRVPILALTAHALQSERDSLVLDGFDEVISKPCLPDQLVAAIRQVLAAPE